MRILGRSILGSTLFLSTIVVGVRTPDPVPSDSVGVRSAPDCSDLPAKVPTDLSIYYVMEGSMKMGPQFYRIDPRGDGTFTFANGAENHMRRPITRDSTVWTLSLDQVQKIYDLVRDQQFFCVHEEDTATKKPGPRQTDGWEAHIAITAVGLHREVNSSDAHVLFYASRIENSLVDLLTELQKLK